MALLQAVQATPGGYIDTNWACHAPHLFAALKVGGKKGIGRYVPLPGVDSKADITAQELQDICGAGFLCWLVQHPRYTGWNPKDHDPIKDATAAVTAAQAAGYPLGCHLFLDYEGMSIATARLDALAFAEGWQKYVIAAGFRAGMYCGYAVPLSPLDYYELPGFDCYWSDMAARTVAKRGFCIKQRAQVRIDGVDFDPDEVQADALGGLPWMCGVSSV